MLLIGSFLMSPRDKNLSSSAYGLAHATGVHEHNTVPYARFALKKRHGFCAKAREKKHAKAQIRHTLGTVKARFKYC